VAEAHERLQIHDGGEATACGAPVDRDTVSCSVPSATSSIRLNGWARVRRVLKLRSPSPCGRGDKREGVAGVDGFFT
jgi:hypothetical protein